MVAAQMQTNAHRFQRKTDTLVHDLPAELGFPLFALCKHDRELVECRALPVKIEFHLHQEGVALGLDLRKVDLPQRLCPIAYEAGSHIMHRHTGKSASIQIRAEA